jgi:hypothetical protein
MLAYLLLAVRGEFPVPAGELVTGDVTSQRESKHCHSQVFFGSALMGLTMGLSSPVPRAFGDLSHLFAVHLCSCGIFLQQLPSPSLATPGHGAIRVFWNYFIFHCGVGCCCYCGPGLWLPKYLMSCGEGSRESSECTAGHRVGGRSCLSSSQTSDHVEYGKSKN